MKNELSKGILKLLLDETQFEVKLWSKNNFWKQPNIFYISILNFQLFNGKKFKCTLHLVWWYKSYKL